MSISVGAKELLWNAYAGPVLGFAQKKTAAVLGFANDQIQKKIMPYLPKNDDYYTVQRLDRDIAQMTEFMENPEARAEDFAKFEAAVSKQLAQGDEGILEHVRVLGVRSKQQAKAITARLKQLEGNHYQDPKGLLNKAYKAWQGSTKSLGLACESAKEEFQALQKEQRELTEAVKDLTVTSTYCRLVQRKAELEARWRELPKAWGACLKAGFAQGEHAIYKDILTKQRATTKELATIENTLKVATAFGETKPFIVALTKKVIREEVVLQHRDQAIYERSLAREKAGVDLFSLGQFAVPVLGIIAQQIRSAE